MTPLCAACRLLRCLPPDGLRTQSYKHMQLRYPRRLRSQHSAPSTCPDNAFHSLSQAGPELSFSALTPAPTLSDHAHHAATMCWSRLHGSGAQGRAGPQPTPPGPVPEPVHQGACNQDAGGRGHQLPGQRPALVSGRQGPWVSRYPIGAWQTAAVLRLVPAGACRRCGRRCVPAKMKPLRRPGS